MLLSVFIIWIKIYNVMQNSSDLRKIKEYQYQHESIKILSFSHLMNYLTKKPSKHSPWSNRPVVCRQLCQQVIWSYNKVYHYKTKHGRTDTTEFDVSLDEKKAVLNLKD